MDNQSAAESPGKREFVIFAVVALGLLMSSLDSTIVSVALPAMLRELNTNLAWIGWTLTGYQLALTIIMPMAGKLSDDWGRKRLFLCAVALFTLSSIGAGMSSNIYLLIVFRVLQAIGGGTFLPSATGIISDAFGNKRAAAIGLFSTILPLGGILGPNIGGFIVDSLSWRWIFFVNVPIGITLLALGWFVLPKSEPCVGNRKVDLVGVGLFSGAMLSILYGLTVWGNEPKAVGDPAIWILLTIGAILIGLFIRHERREAVPMMELNLLSRRPFLAANLFNFVYGACVFGFSSFIPFYATVAYGMSAEQSGIILSSRSFAMAVTAGVNSLFIMRLGYRRPMIFGAVVISASLIFTSLGFHSVNLFGLPIPDMALMAFFMLIAGIGTGSAAPASNNATLDLVPEKIAAVAGIRGMFRTLGGVIGTAIIVLVLSHFEDKGLGAQYVFLGLAVLIVAVMPFIFWIPDLVREPLEDQQETEAEPGYQGAIGG